LSVKDPQETICFFVFLANPSQSKARASLIKAGMRATVGVKDSVFLHEMGARVNKHFLEFNDFSTICGKTPLLVNPFL
jgi:hypothetical protein